MSEEQLNIPVDLDLSAALRSLNLLKASINASVANASNFQAPFQQTLQLAQQLQSAIAGGASHVQLASGEMVSARDAQGQLLTASQKLSAAYDKQVDSIQAGAATLNIQLIAMREQRRQVAETSASLQNQITIAATAGKATTQATEKTAITSERVRAAITAAANQTQKLLIGHQDTTKQTDKHQESIRKAVDQSKQLQASYRVIASEAANAANATTGGGSGAAAGKQQAKPQPAIGGALIKAATISTGLAAFSKVRSAVDSVSGAVRGVTATLDQFNVARLAAKADPALNLIKGLFTNFGTTVAKIIDWVTTRFDAMFTYWRQSASSGVGALKTINEALDRLFQMITKHLVDIRGRLQASINAEGSLIPGLAQAAKVQEDILNRLFGITDSVMSRIEARLAGTRFEMPQSLASAFDPGETTGLERAATVLDRLSASAATAIERSGKLEANLAGLTAIATGRMPATSGVVSDYASAIDAAIKPAQMLSATLNVETKLVQGLNAGLAWLQRGYYAVTTGMAQYQNRKQQLNAILANTPAAYRRWAIAIDHAAMVMRPFVAVVNMLYAAVKKLASALSTVFAPLTALSKIKSAASGLIGFGKAAASATGKAADLTSGAMYLSSGLMGVAAAGKIAEKNTTNIFLGGARGVKSMITNLLTSKLAIGAMAVSAVMWGKANAVATETANVKFGTLLRSMEQGVALNEELVSFSATTPYQIESLREGAGLLVAAKVAAGDVTGELRMIGDIASGVSKPIEEFAQIYQKMAMAPKVDLGMLQQLAERGVPIYDELQKQLGVSRAEMFKMISAGEVGFTSVRNAMKAMTDEGGMFQGSMQKQSETYAGLWSTFKDNVGIAFEQVGGIFVATGKRTLQIGISIVQSVTSALKQVRPAITAWLEFTQVAIRTFWRGFTAAFGGIVSFLKSAFGIMGGDGQNWLQSMTEYSVIASTALTYMVENWQQSILIGVTWSIIKLEQLRSWTVNFFTGTLPTVISVAAGWLMQIGSAAASGFMTAIGMIGSGLSAVAGYIPTAFMTAFDSIVSGIQAIPQAVITVGTFVITALVNSVAAMTSVVAGAFSSLSSIATALPGILGTVISAGFSRLVSAVSALPSVIGSVVSLIGTALQSVFTVGVSIFSGLFSFVVNGAATMFDGLMTAIGSFFSGASGVAMSFGSGIASGLSSIFASLVNVVFGAIGSVLSGVGNMFGSILDVISQGVVWMVDKVFSGLGTIAGFFYKTIPGMLAYFWDNWSTVFLNAGSYLLDVMKNAISKIGELIYGLWEWISTGGTSALSTMTEGITSSIKSGMNKIMSGPERSVSGFEQSMKESLKGMTGNFGEGMNDAINEALAKLKKEQSGLKIELPKGQLPGGDGPDAGTKDTPKQSSSFIIDAVKSNSAEALKLIFGAQSKDQTPQKQLEVQKQIAKGINQLNKNKGSGAFKMQGAVA